jgi:predicted transposase YdaD
MYFDVLRKRVGDFKKTEEGRRAMCETMEKIKAEGKRETMIATAKRLLANGKLVLKEIAQCTGLSLAQVKKLQASMA